jgi:hypothetical protein
VRRTRVTQRAAGVLAGTLATGLLGAGLLAGCGRKPLSSNELARRATEVCQLAAAQTGRIPTPARPEDSALFLKRGIAVMTGELAQLRALRPPSDVADVYAVSISSFAQKLEYLNKTVHALAGGEDPVIAMRTLQQNLAPVEKDEDGAWRALEIDACVNR